MGMLGMPSLTVFHPGQENETRDNHYGIDNSKSSHCLFSSLSKIKPTRKILYNAYKHEAKGKKLNRNTSYFPNQKKGCVPKYSTDITYIRLRQGFVYLVAVLDWYSRYVLSWRISNTLV